MACMYFLLQFRDQGHALLWIRHDLVSVFWLDSYIYTQFDDLNTGNSSASELPDFKFFWGEHAPPRPPSKRVFVATCQYHRLLLSNWQPTSKFIETPG